MKGRGMKGGMTAMAEFPPVHIPDAAARRRQRAKNLAIAALVAALCLLFYLITIVRMGHGGPVSMGLS